MPRRKIELYDPTDAEQVKAYIEAKASQTDGERLQNLLKQLPKPIRDANLRRGKDGYKFNITTLTQKVAAATHIRGQIAETPCSNCQEGCGPFADCVLLSGFDDLTKMCCSNCQWDLKTTSRSSRICDFAKSRPHLSRVNKPRPLPFGFDQESAIASSNQVHGSRSSGSLKPGAENIHILGDLFLPAFDKGEENLQTMVSPLLPDLKALHERDMSSKFSVSRDWFQLKICV